MTNGHFTFNYKKLSVYQICSPTYIDIDNWALNAGSEPASLMRDVSVRIAGPRHVLPRGASEAAVSGNHQEGHRRGQRRQAAVGRRQVRGPGKLTASYTRGSEVSVAMMSPPRRPSPTLAPR